MLTCFNPRYNSYMNILDLVSVLVVDQESCGDTFHGHKKKPIDTDSSNNKNVIMLLFSKSALVSQDHPIKSIYLSTVSSAGFNGFDLYSHGSWLGGIFWYDSINIKWLTSEC